jgi:hypothetical protein
VDSIPAEKGTGARYKGSGILNVEGDREATLIQPLPNTNINHPRTLIPMLIGTLEPGEYKLVTAVLGQPCEDKAAEDWKCPPVDIVSYEEPLLV